ncbi:ribosome recycling factor [Lachnospiraceae bacterium NK3A20]|jgi:ribosome recycling factor|nr:ribosome recycling factor [Lachnospiraceae bacterium NK3A20]
MSDQRVRDIEERMIKSVEFLEDELQSIRAGRANPHILDRIKVDYYGTPTPIQQVANISVPEARIIQIQPWDKSLIKDINRAIQMADIGINPTTDATSIRLIFPEMTEENRRNITKDVKKKGEEAKVAVRNLRRDGNEEFKKLKKAGEISEDVIDGMSDDLQKITDKYIKDIDEIIEKKNKEIMTI